jgi:hypothetical protein
MIVGAAVLVAVCFFYTIPLIGISFLSNLAAVTQYVPFLETWSNDSQWSFAAAVGVLPPLLSVILQLILPMLM